MIVNVDDSKTLRHFLESPPIGAVFEENDFNVLGALPVLVKTYAPHTIVSSQGDWANSLHIIKSGWGCIYRDLADGDRQILDFPMKGDFLGFRTGIGFNYYTLISVTEMSVFELSLDHLTECLVKSPRLAMTFIELMARQRAILVEHVISIGRRSGLVRVAHLLLELGHRARLNGTGNAVSFFCPLTQTELGDALGLTAIHINRMLRELRSDGLLTFRNNLVEFLNKPALTQISSFDEDYLNMEIFPRFHLTSPRHR
ncbi:MULTISPECIES: Crp/Fnr family transcriptional regulator [Ochrobactrum]|uniref:Crp/Fnr family transcriptional regulator n=1 Tax=Ochrobactrum chromiisoli TaxID=2993941 RepID=A0ABT3QT80_9HYPH|nr:Crp/Fnr family transcriptional regulator [Ochrobactrum chromiisoli]MCX2698808.1 Crp/Fnr family transcriptional regulator [Ochrobactrum chromiisoli]